MAQSLTPAKFISLLGDLPKRVPLDVKILEEQKLDNYVQKLIEYTIEDEERVQAFLLIPRQKIKKVPGVLAIHQDGDHRPYEYGKSEPAGLRGDPELQYGLETCLSGYVVICPDRFPFESRSLANSKFKKTFSTFPIFTRYQSKELDLTEDLYQGCVANRLLFQGRTAMGKVLFEMQRALDVLCDQPEVDSNRLGVIGHSAGGLYATLVMYIDPRVKAGCSSSGTFLFSWWFGKDTLRPINGLFGIVPPGLQKWGDVDDILAGLAPRAFLETEGIQNITDEMREDKTRKARLRYQEQGVPEKYKFIVYEGGHVFPKDMRDKSYAWFDRWLKTR